MLQLEVLDVDLLRSESLSDAREDPRPVGHMYANALEVTDVRERLLEQPPAVARSLADPAREPAGVVALERMLQLLDPSSVLCKRPAQLGCIVPEDVDPDPRVGACNARHVAQRSTGCGKRLVPVDPKRARMVEHDVRQGVRQMAGEGQQPIVRARIDRYRNGAERGHETVQEAIALRLGLGQRSKKPGRAVEELGARMGGPARLRAADRMASDEAPPIVDS